jgi:hypothetical protein
MSQNPNEPKIIVDSDWKAQAQAEREKLAAQEKKSSASKPAQGSQGAEGQAEGLPPADFRGILELLIMQAITYMGGFPDPETGRAVVSLEHAKYYVDLLAILEQKTKGNLTAEEATDLTQVLNQLRLQFVEVSKAVQQAIARGALKGQGGAGAAGTIGGPAMGIPPVGPATGPGLGL